MSAERGLSRRDFLEGLGSGAAAGLAAALLGCARDPALAGALGGFFADARSAAAVGRAYLVEHPDESDVAALVAALAGAARARGTELVAADPAGLARALRAQHRDDFASGRVARVRGWVLSRTEARLCALAALARG